MVVDIEFATLTDLTQPVVHFGRIGFCGIDAWHPHHVIEHDGCVGPAAKEQIALAFRQGVVSGNKEPSLPSLLHHAADGHLFVVNVNDSRQWDRIEYDQVAAKECPPFWAHGAPPVAQLLALVELGGVIAHNAQVFFEGIEVDLHISLPARAYAVAIDGPCVELTVERN